MRSYALWSAFTALLAVGRLVKNVTLDGFHSVSLSKACYLVVHLTTVVLFRQCSSMLPTCATPSHRHLGALMQSLRAMGIAFMQMTTMNWFVCAVTMMEAAIHWPRLVVVFGAIMALFSAIRMAAIQYVLTKYPVNRGAVIQMLSRLQHGRGGDIPWIDKIALYMVGGYMMVCYDLPDVDADSGTSAQSEDEALREELRNDEDMPNEACECEYEFSRNQERSFSIFMDSLRDTSGATSLMGAAAVMATASNIAAYGLRSTQWVGTVLDSVEAGIMAACMLFAVGCFSRVLTTQGHDVQLVMKGISSERGLSKLFARLTGVQKGATRVTLLFLVLSFVASSAGQEYLPLVYQVGNKFSSWFQAAQAAFS